MPADRLYVEQLALWAREDPDMVRRYINRLIAESTIPRLEAMSDDDFYAYARRYIKENR